MPDFISPREILPDSTSCALLVVDVQERLCAAMPGDVSTRLVRNVSILLECAREFDLPVLASEQYPRGLGPTMPEIRKLLGEEIQPIDKVVFSCCAVPAIQSQLDHMPQHGIILCGIETHVCVLQTGLDLLQSGRRVYVAADACASRNKQNWRFGLDLLRQAGAVIASTETLAFGLLRAAGTDSFKRLSQLIK
jgi:nicotinamidase-related amidase